MSGSVRLYVRIARRFLGERSEPLVDDLALDDVDWRAGELVVHGKRSRIDRLPLPGDVGEALAD